MKTVSTKLDNSDFKKFQDMCNYDGTCASEAIRDMIKRDLDAHDEYLESLKEEKKLVSETKESKITVKDVPEKPRPIAHGKILDDDGTVIGTF